MIEVFAIPSRREYQAEEQDSPSEEIRDLEMIEQLEPMEDSWAIDENDHVVHLDKDCWVGNVGIYDLRSIWREYGTRRVFSSNRVFRVLAIQLSFKPQK
ncbi:unnamed protein product [Trichogramma brassicae]|uniref:Uncharacterized protein n=1 Tax=Trichogramma brassicae TaxID=86971 RepID=A0A6H5IIV9_9HYME|nr:unnamed protein product [Trichogramma brassicae]